MDQKLRLVNFLIISEVSLGCTMYMSDCIYFCI